MIQIIESPIDTAAVLESVRSREAGANLLFVGTTREFTTGQQTLHLEYDAYSTMARKQMELLESQARDTWPLIGCAMVHRVGIVALGDASVAIAVSSGHRDAAFAAGRWLIDELKVAVPIWKKENWVDGSTEWVHPAKDV